MAKKFQLSHGPVSYTHLYHTTITRPLQQYFKLFLKTFFIELTDEYYKAIIDAKLPSQFPMLQKWFDTSLKELYIFIAVTRIMVCNKHVTIQEQWSSCKYSCKICVNIKFSQHWGHVMGSCQ